MLTSVSDRRFAIVVPTSLALAAVFLALAGALDRPVLAVIGVAFLALMLGAREAWVWRGAGRQWLMLLAALAAIVLAGLVLQQLAG